MLAIRNHVPTTRRKNDDRGVGRSAPIDWPWPVAPPVWRQGSISSRLPGQRARGVRLSVVRVHPRELPERRPSRQQKHIARRQQQIVHESVCVARHAQAQRHVRFGRPCLTSAGGWRLGRLGLVAETVDRRGQILPRPRRCSTPPPLLLPLFLKVGFYSDWSSTGTKLVAQPATPLAASSLLHVSARSVLLSVNVMLGNRSPSL